jgi:FAD/FMN-containing dehydrogenase
MADLIPNFHGDIVTPSDPSYTSAIARWATNSIQHAKVVTFPKDQDDIVLAIAYAKLHSLPLAIRGGGHHPAGPSSVEGGLVIDLSRYFNGVRVDPESKRAYVGGGATWATVDKEAIKYGLATVGGTVNHVGGSDTYAEVDYSDRCLVITDWSRRVRFSLPSV